MKVSEDAYAYRRACASMPTTREQRGKMKLRASEMRAYLAHEQCGLCAICGGPFGSGDLAPSIDHIVPRSSGGTNEIDNLRAAHCKCNNAKGSAHPEDYKLAEKYFVRWGSPTKSSSIVQMMVAFAESQYQRRSMKNKP